MDAQIRHELQIVDVVNGFLKAQKLDADQLDGEDTRSGSSNQLTSPACARLAIATSSCGRVQSGGGGEVCWHKLECNSVRQSELKFIYFFQ